jgi:hypothetical protein
MLLSCSLLVRAEPTTQPVDWDKALRLYQRSQHGERLTADEQAYLDHAKEVRRQMNKHHLPATQSTGLTPLTQMTANDKYKGMDGGLYGSGKNGPPEKLLKSAMEASGKIHPLDANGKPATDGRIVLMSIGMSNTTQEFGYFMQFVKADPAKSPKVTIVDAAQGGQDAAKWDTTAAKSPWSFADERLRLAGVTRQQVQAIWLKQAMITPAQLGEFPAHSDKLKQHIESIIRMAHERFPNLRLVYLSSRTYGGYATTMLNPEPYAYESAFAVRGVIDDEMKSDLREPIVLWGPYLWTNGTSGRSLDGMKWMPEDVGPDGTHPSQSGRRKVGQLLLNFFKNNETTKSWFTVARATSP